MPSARNREPAPSRRLNRGRGGAQGDPREKLLSVALDLFALHGFDGVSTNMIAKAAGVSQPMIYYHFSSKDQLWQDAIVYLMRDLGRRFPRNSSELKDLEPSAQLNVIIRRFLKLSFHDPRLSQLIINESIGRGDRLDWFTRTFIAEGFGDFDRAIERGIECGQVKDLPLFVITNTIVASCSLIFCIGALVHKIYDVDVTDESRFEEIADTVIEIIFNGILTRKE